MKSTTGNPGVNLASSDSGLATPPFGVSPTGVAPLPIGRPRGLRSSASAIVTPLVSVCFWVLARASGASTPSAAPWSGLEPDCGPRHLKSGWSFGPSKGRKALGIIARTQRGRMAAAGLPRWSWCGVPATLTAVEAPAVEEVSPGVRAFCTSCNETKNTLSTRYMQEDPQCTYERSGGPV